jgi:hypothetical protein
VLEILDCGALAQELRIGYDGKVSIGAQLANDSVDLVVGSDRHSRFNGDDREAFDFRRDFMCGVIDV